MTRTLRGLASEVPACRPVFPRSDQRSAAAPRGQGPGQASHGKRALRDRFARNERPGRRKLRAQENVQAGTSGVGANQVESDERVDWPVLPDDDVLHFVGALDNVLSLAFLVMDLSQYRLDLLLHVGKFFQQPFEFRLRRYLQSTQSRDLVLEALPLEEMSWPSNSWRSSSI
jgi:hypothetical protein